MLARRLTLTPVLVLATTSAAPATAQSTSPVPTEGAARGLILARSARDAVESCAPGLALGVVIAPETVPGTTLLLADLEVHGRTAPRSHPATEAVYHIHGGWGLLLAGSDTFRLAPGSVAYVPPARPHVLASVSGEPLRGTLVLRPHDAAAAPRGRSAFGCAPESGEAREGARGTTASATALAPTVAAGDLRVLQATEGERIPYCVFPLTLTAQIDADAAPSARITAATATLRRGQEAATHGGDDEVAVVTHGRGRAFVGPDTVAVESGAVILAPRGVRHGFMHDGTSTLEYFVVFSEPGPRELFRRFAARPGPYCPAEKP